MIFPMIIYDNLTYAETFYVCNIRFIKWFNSFKRKSFLFLSSYYSEKEQFENENNTIVQVTFLHHSFSSPDMVEIAKSPIMYN